MLKPLHEALARWRPPEQIGGDALGELTWRWTEIVGPDIARNARPIAIAAGTLIVATRSSVWSQQLGFLHEKILSEANKLQAEVKHVRFRVGLRVPLAPRSTKRGAVRRTGTPRPQGLGKSPADSEEDLLGRLRAAITDLHGQTRCTSCGAPTEGSRCAPCRGASAAEAIRRLGRLLYEVPWTTSPRAREQIPGLSEADYDGTRRQLLARWWGMLQRVKFSGHLRSDGLERRIAMSYVILQSRLPPDGISSATVRNLLGSELSGLLFDEGKSGPNTGVSPRVANSKKR